MRCSNEVGPVITMCSPYAVISLLGPSGEMVIVEKGRGGQTVIIEDFSQTRFY